MPNTLTRREAFLSAGAGLLLPAAAEARKSAAPRDGVERHLPRLDAIIADVMRRTGVPGLAVAVVEQDRVAYLEGFGLRRADATARVDADTVFALASLSKPITTTVVAGLVGDDVVSWDDAIARHLPDFALNDPWISHEATLRDMFCHRSGLPDHGGDLVEDIGYGRDEILRRLRYLGSGGPFRAHYAYTNMGFTAAAVAAARAAGKPWEEICADRLYRPLGMASASSRYADLAARGNRAFGHVRRDGAWIVGPQREPDAQSPAGGVSASARDMAAFLRLQLGRGAVGGREIVKRGALDETHRPHIVSNPAADPAQAGPDFYALGWNVSYEPPARLRRGHSGAFAMGAATCINILPARGVGIVALSNAAPVGAPEAICKSFLDLVLVGSIEKDWLALFGAAFAKMFGPAYGRDADYTKPPVGAAPARALSLYAGEYRNALYGPAAVTESAGALSLTLGPKRTLYPMRRYSGDVFTFQPPGENAAGPSAIRFTRDGEKAVSVSIDYFNENGQGVFMREG